MTSAVLGSLAQFKLGDGASPIVYTKVAEVLRVGEIGSTAPEVSVTNLDSTSQEYIGGLVDGNQFEIEMNHLVGNTEQELLRDGVGVTKVIQMTWNDSPNTNASFSAVVLDFSRGETTPEVQLKSTCSFRITGDITWS